MECTVCKGKLEEPERKVDRPITQGLCSLCRSHVATSHKCHVHPFLEGLPLSTFVFSADGRVQCANRAGRTLLKKDQEGIASFLKGEVFGCKHASRPEGCGKTVHCGGCSFREALENTLSNGNLSTPKKVDLLLKREKGYEQACDMLLVTEAIDGSVLAQIKEMRLSLLKKSETAKPSPERGSWLTAWKALFASKT